jgi:hypothetical protein
MNEAEDDEQLAFAASQQRAFVTFNHKHLAVLHEQYLNEGKEHWGLSFPPKRALALCAIVYCGYSTHFRPKN